MSTRVVSVALGSLGDVRPHIALGQQLAADGREVLLLVLKDAGDLVRARDVPVATFPASMPTVEGRSALETRVLGQLAVRSQAGAAHVLMSWQKEIAGAVADTLLAQVRSGDVVVTGILTLGAVESVARHVGAEVVVSAFVPMWPTAHGESHLTAPLPHRVHPLNALTSRPYPWLVARLGAAVDDAVRDRLGLTRRSHRERASATAHLPALLAASPLLAPAPADAVADVVATGPWIPDGGGGGDARERLLRDFVAGGSAPVYIGFGSMPTASPEREVRLFMEAARRAQVRLVVRPAVGYRGPSRPLPGVWVLRPDEVVDHDALFGGCAAVVHHGGAGTTHAALRSGVPSLVVPHAFDQVYFGRRTHDLGVGPPPLPRRRLSASRLAERITALTRGENAPTYRRRAAEVAEAMSHEDGAATAATHLRAP
ncbi:MAG: glycosyltransferase [Mobilicoccus sp.]|nr:glycosyltransferase [Mobilicoccus sp.]